MSDLSLIEYTAKESVSCRSSHSSNCPTLLQVAQIVLKDGSCELRKAFEITSPGVKYDTEKARRNFL